MSSIDMLTFISPTGRWFARSIYPQVEPIGFTTRPGATLKWEEDIPKRWLPLLQ